MSGLREAMKKGEISFQSGPSWTIDAPYRKSKRELTQFAKEGILVVEMEATALVVANVVGFRESNQGGRGVPVPSARQAI